MPGAEEVHLDVRDVTLREADGAPVRLGTLPGVQLVVLMRHRH